MRITKLEFRTIVTALFLVAFASFVPAQTTPSLPTDEQVAAKVNEYMKAVLDVDGFSGTVLVARDGRPIVSKGYGHASIELNVPNTPNAVFRPEKGETGYTYGWSVGKRFGRLSISHGGGIYGYATHISRYPDDRVTVIVLSNIQSVPAGPIGNNLSAIVFGAPYELPKERREIALDPRVLEQYVGEYQIGTNLIVTITLENGKLMGQIGGQSKFSFAR